MKSFGSSAGAGHQTSSTQETVKKEKLGPQGSETREGHKEAEASGKTSLKRGHLNGDLKLARRGCGGQVIWREEQVQEQELDVGKEPEGGQRSQSMQQARGREAKP